MKEVYYLLISLADREIVELSEREQLRVRDVAGTARRLQLRELRPGGEPPLLVAAEERNSGEAPQATRGVIAGKVMGYPLKPIGSQTNSGSRCPLPFKEGL
jgi:hypothetical protein